MLLRGDRERVSPSDVRLPERAAIGCLPSLSREGRTMLDMVAALLMLPLALAILVDRETELNGVDDDEGSGWL